MLPARSWQLLRAVLRRAPGALRTLRAAVPVAPELMPTNSPSSLASFLAVSRASWLDTCTGWRGLMLSYISRKPASS